jgi:hypothetical protein
MTIAHGRADGTRFWTSAHDGRIPVAGVAIIENKIGGFDVEFPDHFLRGCATYEDALRATGWLPTIRVRILVRVDRQPDGSIVWNAVGWNGMTDLASRSDLNERTVEAGEWTDEPRFTWVEADVPVPLEEATVEGEVTSMEALAYYRDRCPVAAEDVERAGVTILHARAWLRGQERGEPDRLTCQAHSLAKYINVWALELELTAFGILDAMASTAPVEGEVTS